MSALPCCPVVTASRYPKRGPESDSFSADEAGRMKIQRSIGISVDEWVEHVRNMNQFPSPFFPRIFEINCLLSQKVMSRLERENWQSQRDHFLSQELVSSSDEKDMKRKLGFLSQHNSANCDFQIKELNLEGFKHGCPISFLHEFSRIQGLVSLKLTSPRNIMQKGDFSQFSTLRYLSVEKWHCLHLPSKLIALAIRDSSYLSDEDLDNLKATALKILILVRCPGVDAGCLHTISNRFPHLCDLMIQDAHFTRNTDFTPLRRLSQLASLTVSTELHHSFHLTFAQLRQLLKPNSDHRRTLPKLERLTLGFFEEGADKAAEEVLRERPRLSVKLLSYSGAEKTMPAWRLPSLHLLLQPTQGSLLNK